MERSRADREADQAAARRRLQEIGDILALGVIRLHLRRMKKSGPRAESGANDDRTERAEPDRESR